MADIMATLAAFFAATASFLVLRIKVKSLSLSNLPQLVLSGWDRPLEGSGTPDRITFKSIRNVGNGPARDIVINTFSVGSDTAAGMTTTNLDLLESNQSVNFANEIALELNQASRKAPGLARIRVKVEIVYWDVLENRHVTTYDLFVAENSEGVLIPNQVAQGVSLMRKDRTESARRLIIKAGFINRYKQLKQFVADNESIIIEYTPFLLSLVVMIFMIALVASLS